MGLAGVPLAPGETAMRTDAPQNGLGINGCWHRRVHAKQEFAPQVPTLSANVRQVLTVPVERDGKQGRDAALKQISALRTIPSIRARTPRQDLLNCHGSWALRCLEGMQSDAPRPILFVTFPEPVPLRE
jgi:hypothetical protein